MINSQFKIQPVAAFYKLLAKGALIILGCSTILSVISFFILKVSLLNAIGETGIKEMAQFMERQSTDMMEQSKAMQSFILKYPGIIAVMLLSFSVFLVLFSYLTFVIQSFFKNVSLNLQNNIISNFIPNQSFLKILLFLLIISGFSVFCSGFLFLSISTNPFMGIIAGLFLGMLLVRSFVLIPGIIIGEMSFLDSFKYSFQTITLGRAFKILIFGFLVFFMLSFILSALVYFPLVWFPSNSAKMFFNILVVFLQIGFISVGMTALFFRYGNFEEEKIEE